MKHNPRSSQACLRSLLVCNSCLIPVTRRLPAPYSAKFIHIDPVYTDDMLPKQNVGFSFKRIRLSCRPLVVLVAQRLISPAPIGNTARARTGLGSTDNPRQPTGDAALRLPSLVLRPPVDKVYCRRINIQTGEWLFFSQERPAAHVEGRDGGARAHMGAIDWAECRGACRRRGADGSCRVAENGVHVFEADAASLGVYEVDCRRVSITKVIIQQTCSMRPSYQ